MLCWKQRARTSRRNPRQNDALEALPHNRSSKELNRNITADKSHGREKPKPNVWCSCFPSPRSQKRRTNAYQSSENNNYERRWELGHRPHEEQDHSISPVHTPSGQNRDGYLVRVDSHSSRTGRLPGQSRVALTESIERIIGQESQRESSTAQAELLSTCDFVYDISILQDADQRPPLPRRMVVDFVTDVNMMSEAVQKRLENRMAPYSGEPIQLPRHGQYDVRPLGRTQAAWMFAGKPKVYRSTFLVIKTDEFDILLGRPSIWEHELFRVDPQIALRLRSSKR